MKKGLFDRIVHADYPKSEAQIHRNKHETSFLSDILAVIGHHCDTPQDVSDMLELLQTINWAQQLPECKPVYKQLLTCVECKTDYMLDDHLIYWCSDPMNLFVDHQHLAKEYCPTCIYEAKRQDAEMRSGFSNRERLRTCTICGTDYTYLYGQGYSPYSAKNAVCPDCLDEYPILRRVHQLISSNNNRDKAIHGTLGSLSVTEWLETLKHFDFCCAYCGGKYEHIEHFVAIEDGGHTSKNNCVPSCARCNNIKRHNGPITLANPVFELKRVKKVMKWLGIEDDGYRQLQLPQAGD